MEALVPEGYKALYKHIGVYPELGLFRRFGPLWAKKLHDDSSEMLACLGKLNQELGRVPEFQGMTVLDCPRRIVKEKCPKDDQQYAELWKAWDEYDRSLLAYGHALCESEQIMNLPHQKEFHTKYLTEFKLPKFKPIFEGNQFVPTGEDARIYQRPSERSDTCAWRTLPRNDFLTMRFIYSSRWIETHILGRLRRCFKGRAPDDESSMDIRLDSIVGVMDTISCLLASILLAVTVFILSLVSPLKIRIVILGLAGTFFSLCVKLMTGDPSRSEVFGATAAFYAVTVVFVASTNDKCACV